MKVIDLRKGEGYFEEYSLSKFPDNSLKFVWKELDEHVVVRTTLRSNDDIITIALVKSVLDRLKVKQADLSIDYMMYQQDDRLFADNESFGLKVVSNIINSLNWNSVSIFHPHSDKVEMINNCVILSTNVYLARHIVQNDLKDSVWVIPDSGAFKTQFKMIEHIDHKYFIACMKSRDHITGDIKTVVSGEDLKGRDCFIVDDICLGGRTFLNIASELKKLNCGKLHLVVSHGVFNNGIDHLLEVFETITTSRSLYNGPETDRVRHFS
jgi:ribose-phosphate pyrophosphokinase